MRKTMLVLILSGLLGCSSGSSPSAPSLPTGGGNPAAATITIALSDGYGNSSFAPGNINVPAGGSVTWSNKDNVTHNSTADTGDWANDIPAGGAYTKAFVTRGSFTYHCAIHAGMTGTINVQ